MADIKVSVNGKSYTMACGDGEEDHLRALAGHVDRHVRELSESIEDVSESQLFLMASLTVADELYDAVDRLRRLEDEMGELRETLGQSKEQSAEHWRSVEANLAGTLERAAERLETISKRVADLAETDADRETPAGLAS
ncbi:MAG: cell division protein ZapA [Alphaproteobacteria bacterium]